MILRLYLFSLYATVLLSLALTAFLLFNVNPYNSPFWMLIIFYAGIFLFWASFFGLIGFYLKVWASNREVIFANIAPTLRQSVLIGLAITALLFLQQLRALNWWIAVLVILAAIMLEFFFRSRSKK